METKLNALLRQHGDSSIELKSPDTRKNFWFQNWVIWGFFVGLTYGLAIHSGVGPKGMFTGDGGGGVLFGLLHFLFIASLLMWVITPATRLFFERGKKEVVIKSRGREVRFDWATIRFDSNWIPTKRGGVHFLSIKAGPPFPESIRKQHAKKLAMAGDQGLFVGLGGFDCKSGEMVQAYVRFFQGYMESDESMDRLYWATVGPYS